MLGFPKPEQTPRERSQVRLPGNEPLAALNEFLREEQRFERGAVMNGSMTVSGSPGGYLRRSS